MPPLLNLVLSLLVTAAALFVALAWLASGQIVRRRKPDPPCTPGDLDLNFEHVEFAARDGVQIRGWLTSEAGSRRPTVVFCAGQNGSMDGDTPLVPDFVKAGFDVLQFDWRAHGRSEGERCWLGLRELDDLRGALDFLQARGVQRIGVMGFSMGATVALNVAFTDSRIRCILADSPVLDIHHALVTALQERLGALSAPVMPWLGRLVIKFTEWRLGEPLEELNPLPWTLLSAIPLLFVFGGADPFAPREDQDFFMQWAGGDPKALWRVEDAGHREAHKLRPAAYRDRALSFFKTYLRDSG